MVLNAKRGRPVKYANDEIRKQIRAKQNRINQTICRLKKKLKTANREQSKTTHNKSYAEEIVEYFSKYEYDSFFNGTFNINQADKLRIKLDNIEIKKLNQELGAEFPLFHPKPISLNSLVRYVKKYVNLLIDKCIIERCFVTFEKGDESGFYHTHILIQKGANRINTDSILRSMWLLGSQVKINKVENKLEKLNYMTKQFKPESSRNIDQRLLDSWFIAGEFNNHRVAI